jgi:CheY-like chemotaxis protein
LEPNLVVVSSCFFEIDSYRLAQQIRAHTDPTISGVALLATGIPQDAVQIRRFFRAGVDDVLPKPIETGRLLHCWRRLVTGAWRPAPITALVNEHEAVREAALSWLLDIRPPGLVVGLRSVLWQPAGRDISRAVLQRLGTPDARAVLSEDKSAVWSGL